MSDSARVRLLRRALEDEHGVAIRGNHAVVKSLDRVTFYYRGTPIVEWMFDEHEVVDIYTAFETSPSTRANRKKAREAIREYRLERLQGGSEDE